LTSSIYPVPFVVATTTIAAGTNILSTPITITGDQVSPGGGGILRLLFSFTTLAAADATISVRQGAGATLKGNLNADNNSVIKSDGYFRFDIDVEKDDIVNLQSNVDITTVNFFRAHLVQFGA